MTFAGLYMYDRAKAEVARGERKVQRIEFKEKHLLPLDTSDLKLSAPPTPDPLGRVTPVSATSTTEKNESARRRSSSITGLPPSTLNPNWNLGSIQEMTPPITPRNISPQGGKNRSENRSPLLNGHRRRYSGSVHNLGSGRGTTNGVHQASHDMVEKMDYHPEGVEEKASWE
jgi:hypothetical protein